MKITYTLKNQCTLSFTKIKYLYLAQPTEPTSAGLTFDI